MKRKLLLIAAFAALMLLTFTTVAGAFTPYDTYTYSINGEALPSPAAYDSLQTVRDINMSTPALSVTIDSTSNLVDICCDDRGWVYLSDQKQNRVLALNQDYRVQYVIKTFDSDARRDDSFNNITGLFATAEYLYVCDTYNCRIVMFNLDGTYHKTVSAPETPYMEKSDFRPTACAADRFGRLFVISDAVNQGVIVMSDEGEFTGFIGAQSVTPSVWELFFRRFRDDEDLSSGLALEPLNLDNIALQKGKSGDFIFVVADVEDSAQQSAIKSKEAKNSPVRKLNANGDEILKRNGFFDCGGEVNVSAYTVSTQKGVSKVCDVAVGPEGSWSIIDRSRSKVYTYDSNGQLLFAFGDMIDQEQEGNIKENGLIAIEYQKYVDADGNESYNMLLLDGANMTFTVFGRTEYGDLLIAALHNDNERLYDKSEYYWQKILEANNNFDAAYIGLGKAYYYQGEYDAAMEMLSAAKETEMYAKCLSDKSQQRMEEHPIIPVLIVLAVIAVLYVGVKVMAYAKRVNYAANFKQERTYWEELMYAFYVAFHPFDGFWDIKHEKRGTVRGGLTIMAITAFALYYQVIGRSYIANPSGSYAGFFVQIAAIAVPVVLWAVSNWCLTTLFDGEATFKDVFIATCYSLAPLPVFLVLSTVLTNVLSNGGGNIVTLVTTFGFVWVGFLVFFGTLVVQDYSLGKNVVTCLGTIVCMCVIMFVIILFASLVGDMVKFVSDLSTEIGYRI